MYADNFSLILDAVEHTTVKNRIGRLFSVFLKHPIRFVVGIYSKVRYRFSKKVTLISGPLFFGWRMCIPAPIGLEYYLYGAKAHPSEIRLARFLLNTLTEGAVFFDVGAHFGFYSLLASFLVGKKGRVLSFEPNVEAWEYLNINKKSHDNISLFCGTVSSHEEGESFIKLPLLYSENSSTEQSIVDLNEQFRSIQEEIWVPSFTLDGIIQKYNIAPYVIKIDAEGAEFRILQGAHRLLSSHNPIIVMEYNPDLPMHQEARAYLEQVGYAPSFIDSQGGLCVVDSTSDGFIVFKKNI
ncbi:MAG: FkbM family methyltransferase [Candidatus Paceibacterota bacterium]